MGTKQIAATFITNLLVWMSGILISGRSNEHAVRHTMSRSGRCGLKCNADTAPRRSIPSGGRMGRNASDERDATAGDGARQAGGRESEVPPSPSASASYGATRGYGAASSGQRPDVSGKIRNAESPKGRYSVSSGTCSSSYFSIRTLNTSMSEARG
jgi:hypothetical protein